MNLTLKDEFEVVIVKRSQPQLGAVFMIDF